MDNDQNTLKGLEQQLAGELAKHDEETYKANAAIAALEEGLAKERHDHEETKRRLQEVDARAERVADMGLAGLKEACQSSRLIHALLEQDFTCDPRRHIQPLCEKWLAQIQALEETRSELWSERDQLRARVAELEKERDHAQEQLFRAGDEPLAALGAASENEKSLRAALAQAEAALQGMLDVYEELHAKYDLGDCEATVTARAALALKGEAQ